MKRGNCKFSIRTKISSSILMEVLRQQDEGEDEDFG
jgi:hypothetical protein